MARMMEPLLLAVEGLHVSYSTHEGDVPAVVDCSLRVQQGECVGLVGESGCGKTTVALTIMRYLGANGRIVSGRIVFKGRDLLQCSPKMLRQIRGADIAMVYQEPTAALNPSLTIGTQLREVLYYHRPMRQRQTTECISQMLREVRLADSERVLAAYPHQLSGGQQQRLVIAMALLAQPSLLLLDEPTTALDVTIAAGITELIKEVRHKFGTSMLYNFARPGTDHGSLRPGVRAVCWPDRGVRPDLTGVQRATSSLYARAAQGAAAA